jgi:hypothetical protein
VRVASARAGPLWLLYFSVVLSARANRHASQRTADVGIPAQPPPRTTVAPGTATGSDRGQERLIDPLLDDGPASGSQLRGVHNQTLPTRAGRRASPLHQQTGSLVTRPLGRVCNPAMSGRAVTTIGPRQANPFEQGARRRVGRSTTPSRRHPPGGPRDAGLAGRHRLEPRNTGTCRHG